MSTIDKVIITKYLLIIRDYLKYIVDKVLDNKGISILIMTIIFLIFGIDWLHSVLSGTILYVLTLMKSLVDHKIEKDRLDTIDIEYFEKANKDLEDPLDGYVDLCINEYMILFRGYKEAAYITDKEEALIRKEVLDLIASNMSPLMKRKFELYYGEGRLLEILARKCFIRISLFVADNNKKLYQEAPVNAKNMDDIFRELMSTNISAPS